MDDEQRIGVTFVDGVAIVTLGGEWDLSSRERLHDAFLSIGNQHDVVVDVRDASFFDSSALGELVGFYRRLQDVRRQLEVVVGDSNIARLLDVTDLTELLRPTPERAAYLETILPAAHNQALESS